VNVGCGIDRGEEGGPHCSIQSRGTGYRRQKCGL
jgi:hypothetical protein